MKKRCLSLLLALVMCLALLPATAFAADEKYYSGEDDGMIWNFDPATGALTISGTGPMHTVNYGSYVNNVWTSGWSNNRRWPWDHGGWRNEIVSLVVQDGITEIPLADITDYGWPRSPFKGCANLTSVKLGNDVAGIGSTAFQNCTSLTSVQFGSGLVGIRSNAFESCTSLTSIAFPDSLTQIGANAFNFCTSLSSVDFGSGVSVIWERAFAQCTSLTSVKLPDSLTEIKDAAFGGCSSLSQVELGSSVETIGDGAFSGTCVTTFTLPSSIRTADVGSDLIHTTENVILDNSWTRVGPDVKLNGSYENLTIPASVTEILGNLGNPKIIHFKGTEEQWKAISSASGFPESLRSARVMFGEGWSEDFDIVDNVLTKYYGDGGAVVIPEGVTEIGPGVFSHNEKVTSVTMPASVKKIGANAFWNAHNLTSVTLPDALTTIGNTAFSGCEGLTSITLPATVTTIGDWAFQYCGLTSVTIPGSVTQIGKEAFYRCESLTSVTIMPGVKTIGAKAFCFCPLTEVVIPEGVTAIGGSAFADTLKSIYIPASVTSIGRSALPWSSIVIYYGGSETQWKAVKITGSTDGLTPDKIHCNSPAPAAPAEPTVGNFTDVKTSAFYADAVAWAVEKNITTGTTATTFSPKDNCTHGQILTFLWRAAGSPASNVTLPFATTGNEYYLGAVKWAYEKGMIDKNFNHKTPCTRAYAVQYIWQAFGKPAPTKASPFTDIPAHWSSATAAAWAAEQGITTGTTATAFSPNKICNRGEIVTFLHRAYSK